MLKGLKKKHEIVEKIVCLIHPFFFDLKIKFISTRPATLFVKSLIFILEGQTTKFSFMSWDRNIFI